MMWWGGNDNGGWLANVIRVMLFLACVGCVAILIGVTWLMVWVFHHLRWQ